MRTTEQIKKEYFRQMRNAFSGHPEALAALERHWKAGELREAYLKAEIEATSLGLELTVEQKKADEDYYWVVIN